MEPLAWMRRAICRDRDPDTFFGGNNTTTKRARETCGACPVRQECLDFAISTKQEYGMWGGKSRRELKKLRSLAHRAAMGYVVLTATGAAPS